MTTENNAAFADRVRALLEASSFGTEGARQLQAQTSDETVEAIRQTVAAKRDILEDIDELIDDDQLAAGEPARSGCACGHCDDYPPCPRGCGRDWHGAAITARIETMAVIGEMDPDYCLATDDSTVLCPAPDFVGPMRVPEPTPEEIDAFVAANEARFHESIATSAAAWAEAAGMPAALLEAMQQADAEPSVTIGSVGGVPAVMMEFTFSGPASEEEADLPLARLRGLVARMDADPALNAMLAAEVAAVDAVLAERGYPE
jgi:hypothetical protein